MKNEALANMRNLNATCPVTTGRGFEPDTTNSRINNMIPEKSPVKKIIRFML